jgi:hypothetical protein
MQGDGQPGRSRSRTPSSLAGARAPVSALQTGLRTLPVLPLLAAAYPVVFLFALNAAEQVTLAPLWLPLGAAVGGTAILLVALGLALRDWQRAALLTTVAVVAFFGYGHAWNAVSSVISSQWPLIGAWTLLTVVGLTAAWRAGRWTAPIVRGLTVVALLALLMNGWGLARTMVAFGAADPTVDSELTELELQPPDGTELPDVYYIVPDRYAGGTALREEYEFDNEPFLTALEERGFAVARNAHANYIKTPLSLGSSLNIDFLDAEVLEAQATSGDDREPAHRLLHERLVVAAALKELGYQYLHISNWWGPSATNVDADRTFRYRGQDEFSSVLLQTTLMRAFNEPDAAPDDPWDWRVLREHTAYALDRLDEMPGVPGPKFVLAHLLVPHDPYVFDADGSFMDRAQVAEQGQRESYRRQLTYTNDRLLGLVDRIMEASEDAIIVIQADEGPFPMRYLGDEWGFDWRDATDAQLEEKFGILFAMRVPDADLVAEGFHDAITPVNTFRILFNARFGTDLPLLPDQVWAHEDLDHFYDFFDITDRLR